MMIFNKLKWVKLAFITVCIVFPLFTGMCWAGNQNTFINPTLGFQLTKPEDWHYATALQNLENLKRVQLNNSEMQTALQKYASAPLVIITKFPEPFDDINPSLKVSIKPYGILKGKSPVDILNTVLPQLKRSFTDLTVMQEPVDYTIAGIKSAYARFNYTLDTNDNSKFPITSELWIIPHGDYFFLIGAGTRQDESTGSRIEIQNILKTVIIEQ